MSREDLGNYLGSDLSASEKALQVVDAASDTVRTMTEQVLNEVNSDDIVLDGTGTDSLLLPERPVNAVSSVAVDGDALTVDDDYVLNGDGILFRTFPAKWRRARQNVAVTYDHGYPDDDLPRDLRMVALSIAARLFSQSAGAVFESLGAYSVRYDQAPTELTINEQRVLRKYKRSRSF